MSPMTNRFPFGSGVDLAGEPGQGLGLVAFLRTVGAVRTDQRVMHPPEGSIDLARLLLESVVRLALL